MADILKKIEAYKREENHRSKSVDFTSGNQTKSTRRR